MTEYKDFYTIKDIIKIDTKQCLKEAMKEWGVERTEEKIKEHYGDIPKAFQFLMECYREILRGEIK